jgi:hypothetical protein
MADWTDELRAKVVADYVKAEPTGLNTVSIMEDIAKDTGKSVNGIRMILTKNEVYVKAEPVKGAAKAGAGTGTRVSKQDSIDALVAVMQSEDLEIDESVVNKLTGKAAIYFTGVIKQALGE